MSLAEFIKEVMFYDFYILGIDFKFIYLIAIAFAGLIFKILFGGLSK